MNESNAMPSTALVVRQDGEVQQGGVVRLAANLDEIVEAFHDYQKACEKLLTKDDYQTVRTKQGPKTFKKKSAWRKLQTAFGISTRIVSKDISYDSEDRIHHAEFIVRAEAPNGRFAEAWAGASIEDRDFSHDQDIAATAQTRATSRAIADLIGSGEVSAEEMSGGGKQTSDEPPPGDSELSDFAKESLAICKDFLKQIRDANARADFKNINDKYQRDIGLLTNEHAKQVMDALASVFETWKQNNPGK